MPANSNNMLDLGIAMCAIIGLSVIVFALLGLLYTVGRWMFGMSGCA